MDLDHCHGHLGGRHFDVRSNQRRGRILSTPSIVVTGETLSVGRATIERRFVGAAQPFRGGEATAERGTRLNGLAYLCIRGWIDPVVKIDINDSSDRTPYWLTSTRHPDELTAALSRK